MRTPVPTNPSRRARPDGRRSRQRFRAITRFVSSRATHAARIESWNLCLLPASRTVNVLRASSLVAGAVFLVLCGGSRVDWIFPRPWSIARIRSALPKAVLPGMIAIFNLSSVGTAQSQELPSSVLDTFPSYSELSESTWEWNGKTSYKTSKSTSEYEVNEQYTRSGDRFSWTRGLTLDGKPAGDRVVKFDGRTLAKRHNKADVSWYAAEKLSRSQPHNRTMYVAYFDAVGIHYSNEHQQLIGGQVRSKLEYLLANGGQLLSVHENSRSRERQLIVEIKAAFEQLDYARDNSPDEIVWVYYLSVDNDYAVVRHERRDEKGNVFFVASGSKLFRKAPDLPVIAQVVEVSYLFDQGGQTFSVEPVASRTTRLTLDSLKRASANDSEFVLRKKDTPAGAMVIDAVTPELQNEDGTVKVFEMPASPEDLDAAIAHAAGRRPPRANMLSLALAAVVLAASIGYFLWRKRQ